MAGIKETDKIDTVLTTKIGDVQLAIVEENPWDDEKEQIILLKKKIDTYINFLTSEQFAKLYPDLINKPVDGIMLASYYQPSEKFLKETELYLSSRVEGMPLRFMFMKRK